MLNQAKQRIGFIHSFIENPNDLHAEDWKIWRPLIANASAQVMNEDFRKRGFEVIKFFDFHFDKKKYEQL